MLLPDPIKRQNIYGISRILLRFHGSKKYRRSIEEISKKCRRRCGECVEIYRELNPGELKGLLHVKANGKWGLLDATGKNIVPPEYDDLSQFREDLAAVKKDDKWGYIDKTGKIIIPCAFDNPTSVAPSFRNGRAYVELNDRRFYINKNGQEIKY